MASGGPWAVERRRRSNFASRSGASESEKRIGKREIVVGLQGTRREEQSQKAALDRIAQTVKDFAAGFLSAQRIPSGGGSIEKLQAGDSRQGDFAAP